MFSLVTSRYVSLFIDVCIDIFFIILFMHIVFLNFFIKCKFIVVSVLVFFF
jgi:hypothetical protein